CGRLAAVSAVLGTLRSSASARITTNIGLLTFAGGVVTTLPPRGTDAFAAGLDADLACNFVSQGSSVGYHPQNPGAIRANVNASTNYAAALDAARAMLDGTSGRKVIYFVSDGMPT